jgi:CHAT domain-containing protein
VNDIGTQILMPKFYSLRQSGMSKAQALQRAQLALLNGEVTAQELMPAGQRPQPFTPPPGKAFAHPYYWAPFILIGNWK